MATITIKAGENIILSIPILDTDGSTPIAAAQIKALEVAATQDDKVLKKWRYDSGLNHSDRGIELSDGLVKVEIEGPVSAGMSGAIAFKITPTFIDTDYFESGGQTDVDCFNGLLIVTPC
jgi:hypothetical protein